MSSPAKRARVGEPPERAPTEGVPPCGEKAAKEEVEEEEEVEDLAEADYAEQLLAAQNVQDGLAKVRVAAATLRVSSATPSGRALGARRVEAATRRWQARRVHAAARSWNASTATKWTRHARRQPTLGSARAVVRFGGRRAESARVGAYAASSRALSGGASVNARSPTQPRRRRRRRARQRSRLRMCGAAGREQVQRAARAAVARTRRRAPRHPLLLGARAVPLRAARRRHVRCARRRGPWRSRAAPRRKRAPLRTLFGGPQIATTCCFLSSSR